MPSASLRNVAQIIEQAIEVVRVCKTLHERGSLDENDLIQKYAKDVMTANKELDAAMKSQPASTRTTRLQNVAKDASTAADLLRIELNKLKFSKAQGNPAMGRAFKLAWKTLFKNGKLNHIQTSLKRQERALQSGILKDL